jgi:hypothetical protein
MWIRAKAKRWPRLVMEFKLIVKIAYENDNSAMLFEFFGREILHVER